MPLCMHRPFYKGGRGGGSRPLGQYLSVKTAKARPVDLGEGGGGWIGSGSVRAFYASHEETCLNKKLNRVIS